MRPLFAAAKRDTNNNRSNHTHVDANDVTELDRLCRVQAPPIEQVVRLRVGWWRHGEVRLSGGIG